MSSFHGKPFVTTVMATRNSASSLRAALESFFSQDFTDKELVVIDGASTDGTREILAGISNPQVRYISEPDSGPYDAFNKGIRLAAGEWIHFLGSDDRLHSPSTLSVIASELRKTSPAVAIAHAEIIFHTAEGGNGFRIGGPWKLEETLPEKIPFPHTAAFHRRALFESAGVFNTQYKIAGDYDFILRALRDHETLYLGGIPVVDMAEGGLSSNPKLIRRHLQEIRTIWKTHGIYRGDIWFFSKTWNEYARFYLIPLVGAKTFKRLQSFFRFLKSCANKVMKP